MFVLIVRADSAPSPDAVVSFPAYSHIQAEKAIRLLYRNVRDFKSWGEFTADDPDHPTERTSFVFDICRVEALPELRLAD